MPLFCSLAYLGLLWLFGYVMLCAIACRTRRHPLEILGLSGLLGGALVPSLLFWISLAGFAPRRWVLGMLFVIAFGALVLFIRRGRLVLPSRYWPRFRLADVALLPFGVVIGWTLWTASTQALGFALIDWDGFATWGFRAKALYLDAIPDLHDYFHDLSLSFATPDHPLLQPFLTAGCYAAMGGVYDAVGKICMLFLLWCYTLFLYGALRSFLSRAFALALTAIAVSAPAVLRWGVQGTPDMPLAIFYAASLVFTVRWIYGAPRSELWLAGIFSAACLFTKNEGGPLAAFNFLAVVVCGWKRQPRFARDLALVAGVCILCLLPWVIFRGTLPHTNENYLSRVNWETIYGNRARTPLILAYFLERFFFDWNWSPVWLLILGAYLIASWLRPSWCARLIFVLLLAHVATYLLVYEITPYALSALFSEPMDRLLLHVLPAGILLAAFSLAQFFPAPEVSGGGQLKPET